MSQLLYVPAAPTPTRSQGKSRSSSGCCQHRPRDGAAARSGPADRSWCAAASAGHGVRRCPEEGKPGTPLDRKHQSAGDEQRNRGVETGGTQLMNTREKNGQYQAQVKNTCAAAATSCGSMHDFDRFPPVPDRRPPVPGRRPPTTPTTPTTPTSSPVPGRRAAVRMTPGPARLATGRGEAGSVVVVGGDLDRRWSGASRAACSGDLRRSGDRSCATASGGGVLHGGGGAPGAGLAPSKAPSMSRASDIAWTGACGRSAGAAGVDASAGVAGCKGTRTRRSKTGKTKGGVKQRAAFKTAAVKGWVGISYQRPPFGVPQVARAASPRLHGGM